MNYDKVKYRMIDKDRGKDIWLEADPIGWEESDKTLKRSPKTYGVFTVYSANLRFILDGKDFLEIAFANRDIEANVVLEEHRKHPIIDKYYTHSTATFDFSKIKITDIDISIPFKTGSLNALIKSQISQKFELERLESIKGDVINPLNIKTVGLEGREIFLVTTWDTDNANTNIGSTGNQNVKVQIDTNVGDERGNVNALPLRIVGQSHGGFAETVIPSFNGDKSATTSGDDGPHPGGNYSGAAGHKFFLNSDLDRTLKITFNYDFNVWFQQYENVQWCFFSLSLVTYKNGLNLDVKDRVIIHELRSSDIPAYNLGRTASGITQSGIFSDPILPHDNDFALGKFNKRMTGSHNTTVNLLAGESLAMELWLRSDTYRDNQAGVRVYIQDNDSTMKMEESSYFPQSQSQVVLMHDVGDKLMQIVTGQQSRFKSDFYSSGAEFQYTGLASGYWIRGGADRSIEFSIRDFIDTGNAIHNTGWTIESIGENEIMVVEDMRYFFRNETTIILENQVSNIVRTVARDFYSANMAFGYKDPSGEILYEEAMGLDEYNIRTDYTTPITRVDKKYEKISPSRGDSYGKEFARRLSLEIFPEKDSRYDKTNFVMDLKESPGATGLAERLWQDDFTQAPTNVFSPDTASNLRLTPFRCSERHQWFYGSGLRKFQQEHIRYANNTMSNNMGTKKSGEVERFENGDILISEIEKSLFVNMWIEFDYEVDFFVNEQVYGTTEIEGRQIPNYFGKVQFINENGLKEYGYIFELKPNKEGKWKLLKAI